MSSEDIISSAEGGGSIADHVMLNIQNLDRTEQIEEVAYFVSHLFQRKQPGGMVLAVGDPIEGADLFPRRISEAQGLEVHEILKDQMGFDPKQQIVWECLSSAVADWNNKKLISIINEYALKGGSLPRAEYNSLSEAFKVKSEDGVFRIYTIPIALDRMPSKSRLFGSQRESELERAVREFQEFISSEELNGAPPNKCFLFIVHVVNSKSGTVSRVDKIGDPDKDEQCYEFQVNPDDFPFDTLDGLWFVDRWDLIQNIDVARFLNTLKLPDNVKDILSKRAVSIFVSKDGAGNGADGAVPKPRMVSKAFHAVKTELEKIAQGIGG